MTSTNQSDFDRVLAEWLDEGPHRAPDRPVALAIEHARSHPRRPNPFAFLKGEVMSSRPRYAALQPAWMLLALGLLIAAVAAVIVGSRPSDPVVVPPVSTPTPGVTPAAPSPTVVSFVDDNGGLVTIEIVDGSGLLIDATGGEPMPDVEIPPGASVGVANAATGEQTVLRLAWGGCPNEDTYTVRIDSTIREIVVETVGCQGDTLGVGRTLTLTLSVPVPAEQVAARLVTVP